MIAKKPSLGMYLAALVILLGLSTSVHAQVTNYGTNSTQASPTMSASPNTTVNSSTNSTDNTTGTTNNTTGTTNTTNSTSNTSGTVGLPNTGVGGSMALTLSSLLASIAAIGAGAVYFTRRALS